MDAGALSRENIVVSGALSKENMVVSGAWSRENMVMGHRVGRIWWGTKQGEYGAGH